MSSIRISLNNKIKSIKKKEAKSPENSIPQENVLLINLKRESIVDIQKENIDLKKKNSILESSLQNAREEAFLTGIEEGKEQLRHEMEDELKIELENLKKAIDKILVDFSNNFDKISNHVLILSKNIAKQILKNELKNEDQYNQLLLDQIEKILHELLDQEIITINVCPQQMQCILNADIEKEFNIPDKIKIKFCEDRNLEPGECSLESSNLVVEGKFDSQLDLIESQLKSL